MTVVEKLIICNQLNQPCTSYYHFDNGELKRGEWDKLKSLVFHAAKQEKAYKWFPHCLHA